LPLSNRVGRRLNQKAKAQAPFERQLGQRKIESGNRNYRPSPPRKSRADPSAMHLHTLIAARGLVRRLKIAGPDNGRRTRAKFIARIVVKIGGRSSTDRFADRNADLDPILGLVSHLRRSGHRQRDDKEMQ
jgi:hypothetical protein